MKTAARSRGPISQHKEYAETGKVPDEGNFDVAPFNATRRKTMDRPTGSLSEGRRAIGKARGYHPEPDHGPFDGDA